MASSLTTRKGELVIVGSGIASIRQLTLEGAQYIRAADIVYYCVCDPFTASFIAETAKESYDLYHLYGSSDSKHRADTYIQMSELLLSSVRAGKLVVGVFYGHPGVAVSPSHRAISIAHSEGFVARMLPGISAEDCLFADLGVDPSASGCQTYEATDLLLSKHPLNPAAHLVLFQVSVVGQTGRRDENEYLRYLLDYLSVVYGEGHPVVSYVAGVRPTEGPIVEKVTIGELRDPEVASEKVRGHSTFYIPPKTLAGKTPEEMKDVKVPATSALRFAYPDIAVKEAYDELAVKAVEKLEERDAEDLAPYNAVGGTREQRRAAIQLAANHHPLTADREGKKSLGWFNAGVGGKAIEAGEAFEEQFKAVGAVEAGAQGDAEIVRASVEETPEAVVKNLGTQLWTKRGCKPGQGNEFLQPITIITYESPNGKRLSQDEMGGKVRESVQELGAQLWTDRGCKPGQGNEFLQPITIITYESPDGKRLSQEAMGEKVKESVQNLDAQLWTNRGGRKPGQGNEFLQPITIIVSAEGPDGKRLGQGQMSALLASAAQTLEDQLWSRAPKKPGQGNEFLQPITIIVSAEGPEGVRLTQEEVVKALRESGNSALRGAKVVMASA